MPNQVPGRPGEGALKIEADFSFLTLYETLQTTTTTTSTDTRPTRG